MSLVSANKETREKLKKMSDRAKALLERKVLSRTKLYEKYIQKNFK